MKITPISLFLFVIFSFITLAINFASASEKITVELPVPDFSTLISWVSGFVVLSLSIGAILYGKHRAEKALDPDGDSEYYWRKSQGHYDD